VLSRKTSIANPHEQAMSDKLLEELNEGTLSGDATDEFLTIFKRDLMSKQLFNEDDRPIINGIVTGYLLQRRLVDAVSTCDARTVQALLQEMEAEHAEAALSHAVDQSLDTLLHLAVKKGSAEVITLLLEAGADPKPQR